MSTNIMNSTHAGVVVNKKEIMDKRDLARLLDYYRIRVGKVLFILSLLFIN